LEFFRAENTITCGDFSCNADILWLSRNAKISWLKSISMREMLPRNSPRNLGKPQVLNPAATFFRAAYCQRKKPEIWISPVVAQLETLTVKGTAPGTSSKKDKLLWPELAVATNWWLKETPFA
jgi:hypothetical protein